jgi:hypothetical protein
MASSPTFSHMTRRYLRIMASLSALGVLMAVSVVPSQASDSVPVASQPASTPPATTSSAPATSTNAPMLFGWAHVGPGAPMVDATVRIVTRRGKATAVAPVRTGLNGEFAFTLEGTALPRVVVVEARGGTVDGKAWPGRLRSMIALGPQRHSVHLNAATTISTAWQLSRQRSQAAAANRVRTVLGVESHVNTDAGMRLGTAGLNGRQIAKAIERRGMKRWLQTKLRLMDARKQGPRYHSILIPVRSQAASTPSQAVQPAGIGGIIGGLLWDKVKSAANGCSSSDSAIPGLGYLASALSKYGIVSQDPSCADLPKILADIEAIQQGITQIETALQQTNDNLNAISNLIKVDTLSTVLKELEDTVFSPIETAQQYYTYLADSGQTTVTRVGMPLDEILASKDDSIINDPNVQSLINSAANLESPAGVMGTNFVTAVNSLVRPGTVSDGVSGLNKGSLRLTWEAVRTSSAFIDAWQLATYNEAVDYTRLINSHAAALTIDVLRSQQLTSEEITGQINEWQLPDSWFDTVTTEYLPCPSADDTYNGRCYPMEVWDGKGDVRDWDYVAPVLDPDTSMLWGAICASDTEKVTDCRTDGLVSYYPPRKDGVPGDAIGWWFTTPTIFAYNEFKDNSGGGAFGRPTAENIATLVALANSYSQQSAAVPGWLSTQATVFSGVQTQPIVTDSVAWDCGWVKQLDDLYAFDCGEYFHELWPRIGAQYFGYLIGQKVTGTREYGGWLIPSPQNTTNLSNDYVPFDQQNQNARGWKSGDWHLGGWDGDDPPLNAPPSGLSSTASELGITLNPSLSFAPLVVGGSDVSIFTVPDSAWTVG